MLCERMRIRWILLSVLCLMSGQAGCDNRLPVPTSNSSQPAVATDSGSKSELKTAEKSDADKRRGNPEEESHPILREGTKSDAAVAAVPAKDRPAKRVFRPDDRRRRHDVEKLADVGIHVFESKRLRLYTDLADEIAKPLPGLIDELYADLERYFGPPAPDRAETEYQMSGYLMQDIALFREFGLLPEEVRFEHGCYRANEFWMRDQEFDYYRRHLLIHEATHCFMTIMPGNGAPNWYLEGMAETFGTHRLPQGRPAEFRVMPTSPEEFAGFGRISIIRKEFASNKALSIPAIFALMPSEFTTPIPYAWSWALATFLDQTPQYSARFKELSGYMTGNQFALKFSELFESDWRDLATAWTLFIVNLQYGYDIPRAAIEFRPGSVLEDDHRERACDIVADRGWQSSGVLLEKGQSYEISASGRFTLADTPKPWVSEADGISFRYFDGKPLGILLGCIRSETGPVGGVDESMLNIVTLGSQQAFVAPLTGTLYLRLNDAWNSLKDNTGKVLVKVRHIP